MPNLSHLDVLKQGPFTWNVWRKENPRVRPDLRGADLGGAFLVDADLSGSDLRGAYLSGANLTVADLSGADLGPLDLNEERFSEDDVFGRDDCEDIVHYTDLSGADLTRANLSGASLRFVNFTSADLSESDLSSTNLTGANLTRVTLVETNLEDATLTDCRIFGISAWKLRLNGSRQSDLIITSSGETTITVDDLELAQFIHLLLNNEKLRQVIDTISSKVVLILGRFTPERKAVLDAIRDELRRRNYAPIIFDSVIPVSRNVTETVSTLAHMARFIIADITDPRSIPQELQRIVPDLPSVPIQPLLEASASEYGMFDHFRAYPWVLPVHRYEDLGALLESIGEKVVTPAEDKRKELLGR